MSSSNQPEGLNPGHSELFARATTPEKKIAAIEEQIRNNQQIIILNQALMNRQGISDEKRSQCQSKIDAATASNQNLEAEVARLRAQ